MIASAAEVQQTLFTTNCPPPGLHRFFLQLSNVQLHIHFSITSTILQLQLRFMSITSRPINYNNSSF
jgi:hypothetical protein